MPETPMAFQGARQCSSRQAASALLDPNSVRGAQFCLKTGSPLNLNTPQDRQSTQPEHPAGQAAHST
eukprot:366423-Chlamydomonas_euryale.AAC.3